MSGFSVGDVTSIHETDKAVLCDGGILDEQTWIPKSQIHDDSEVWREEQEGELIVSHWFAEQKGWT